MKRRKVPEWMLTRSIIDYFEYFTGNCWGLDSAEQLKLLNLNSREELFKLKHSREGLPEEIVIRIDYLAKIIECLQILLPDRIAADAWIRKPNDNVLFGGKPALDKMTSGKLEDLKAVRDYLMSECV